LDLYQTMVWAVTGPDGSPYNSQTDHTRSIQGSCEGRLGYEVEEEEPVSVAAHEVGMGVLGVSHDHRVAENVHSGGQGTEDVETGIPHDENLEVQWMGSWDVETYHVDHKDMETVDVVPLVTGIAVPIPALTA